MSSEVEVYEKSDQLATILERANKEKPAKKDINALKKALEENPDLWRRAGDLANLAKAQIIDHATKTKAVEASIKHGLKTMKKDLGYEDASPLERLLIEQITLGWLHYHTTQWGHESTLHGGTSFRNAAYWERRLNGAHRRYLRAVETLARVRKMGPAVQINIAEKQVNQSIR